MRHIFKRLALLSLPVLCWLAFFAAFEPNNYFGLRAASSSTAPIARIKAYEAAPGKNLIIGDSRLAHFDMALANAGDTEWQNLAFGGASLRESVDLANYCLDNGGVDRILLGVSFYTLNKNYDTDRMAALEDTLNNPLAYCFNMEYNVNALTNFNNWLLWNRQRAAGKTADTWIEAQAENETGSWEYPADYTDPDTGAVYSVHTKLAVYPALIAPRCEGWSVNEEQFAALKALAERCKAEGTALTLVLPPMSENVRTLCDTKGITTAMPPVFDELAGWGVEILDYEWDQGVDSRFAMGTDWRGAADDDTLFFDGFHLDTAFGLPGWTSEVFGRVGGTTLK